MEKERVSQGWKTKKTREEEKERGGSGERKH